MPEGVTVERATLATGDFALAGAEELAGIERKATGDILSCFSAGRERFEKELLRSRYIGSFCVVIEGTLTDLLTLAHQRGGGLSAASIVGSLAAWQRRFCPFMFAGSPQLACEFSVRYLATLAREVQRASKSIGRADRPQTSATARRTQPGQRAFPLPRPGDPAPARGYRPRSHPLPSMNIPNRPLWDFADPDPDDDAHDPEPEAPPNRWEVSDTPEEDIVDSDAMDGAEAQAIALRYGVDETLPAQTAALGTRARAIVLDRSQAAGWELLCLEFCPRDGWFVLAVFPPAETPEGIARAAAWLVEHRSPLL